MESTYAKPTASSMRKASKDVKKSSQLTNPDRPNTTRNSYKTIIDLPSENIPEKDNEESKIPKPEKEANELRASHTTLQAKVPLPRATSNYQVKQEIARPKV